MYIHYDYSYTDPFKRIEVLQQATEDRERFRYSNLDDIISCILLEENCNSRLSGYTYICKTIEILVLNKGLSDSISLYIYPKLAQYYSGLLNMGQSTPTRVHSIERNIRYAIEEMWRLRTAEGLLELLFGETDQRPTNAIFLNILADYIRFIYLQK